MNRVVLAGRLAGRPKSSHTPCGVAVAEFCLTVARAGISATSREPSELIDCVALGETAQRLVSFGDPGYRVICEGALYRDTYYNADGRRVDGHRVHCDRAYFVDLPAHGISASPPDPPSRPTATAAHPNGN